MQKTLSTLSFLLLAFLVSGLGLQAQDRNCSAMDLLELQLQQHPEQAQRMAEIEAFTQRYVQEHAEDQSMRQVYTIPVVVHVVYNSNAENISNAQIQSQLDILNDDFRLLNSDADGTWSQAADTEIEFCLATVDPSGNATSGITRTSTSVSSFSYNNDGVKFNSSGGKDAWPAGDYMNMWVCDLSSGLLGYAQFPGGAASTDGVVIDYLYFGDIGTATAPFDLGRTTTHEVGHYLNLRHIWGDGRCNRDDFVGDTPSSDAANYGCALGHVSCRSTDMVQNYMDYSDDACMNLFTQGQKTRMRALFASGGDRASLLNSAACGGTPPPPPATEICDNGLDDDGDGLIDCNDPDCGSDPSCSGPVTCDAPTNLIDVVAGSRKRVTLSWNAANGASSYTVEIRATGGSWNTFNTNNTSIQINGLSRNSSYEWRVSSNCSGGQTATSGIISFNTNSSGRFAEIKPALSIFPNPAQQMVTLEFGTFSQDFVELAIMDMAGRVLFQQTSIDTAEGFMDVDLSSLESGVYLIVIKDGAELHTKKLSVIK